MAEITLACKGRHETYKTWDDADADRVWTWAVRCVRGEDGLYHAFALESDYREFKKLSPTNYR